MNSWSRRQFLQESYLGLGGLALLDVMARDLGAAKVQTDPLAPRQPHLPAKAKRCIFLFMDGGVSQMDTFEYKPALEKYATQRMPAVRGITGEIANNLTAPHRVIPSSFRFAQYGESGRWMCELFPRLGTCADDLAFVYGIKLENNNHPPGVYQVMTGNMLRRDSGS
jgi:hypothetical protein